MKIIKKLTVLIMSISILINLNTTVCASEISNMSTGKDGNYVIATLDYAYVVSKDQYELFKKTRDDEKLAVLNHINTKSIIPVKCTSKNSINNELEEHINLNASMLYSDRGTYEITENTVKSNYTTYYYKNDGSYFNVGNCGSIEIKVSLKECAYRNLTIGIESNDFTYSYDERFDKSTEKLWFCGEGDWRAFITNNSSRDAVLTGSVHVN